MAFQCGNCEKEITPEQALNSHEERGAALCKECMNPYNIVVQESTAENHEATTPIEETVEIPTHVSIEKGVNKSVVPAIVEGLPPICMDIVRPAVSANQAAAAWQEFQALKKAVIDRSDIQLIQGKNFVKKSGWRKLAQYFNLSDDIIQETREYLDGYFVWTIKVRCVAANGRYTIGVGKCASNERKFAHVEHDTYATAHTRAKNRAISDMIAAGEVSAEEMV